MRTVLFAWELGGGLGHVMRIRRLAARLAPHGLRLIAAVKNLNSAHILAAVGVEVMQAPIWPATFLSKSRRTAISTSTFGDILAALGFADEQAVQMVCSAWHRLFALVNADLVVAECSPGCALAARGRIPLVIVGTGYTLPPPEMERFPPLHQNSPPVFREEDIVEIVNRALDWLGSPPLVRLPQIFEADARSVLTFPLLDPYRAHRVQWAEGPILDCVPAARQPDARTIFVYLSSNRNVRAEVFDALHPFADRVRLFGPEVGTEQATELSRRGSRIEISPPPLASALADARLFVHLGGNGAAAEALAAGVPQLVLSTDNEKDLNGQALEWAGVGRLLRIHDPATKISPDIIEAMVEDEISAARAAKLGESHRTLLTLNDPVSKFEHECLRLSNSCAE